MTDSHTLTGVDYVCLICPQPPGVCDTVACPHARWQSLRTREARAREAGREWLSQQQVEKMLQTLDESSVTNGRAIATQP